MKQNTHGHHQTTEPHPRVVDMSLQRWNPVPVPCIAMPRLAVCCSSSSTPPRFIDRTRTGWISASGSFRPIWHGRSSSFPTTHTQRSSDQRLSPRWMKFEELMLWNFVMIFALPPGSSPSCHWGHDTCSCVTPWCLLRERTFMP